jgi:nitroreductase
METIECIMTRRSIRKFTSQTVSEDQVKTLLHAGMYAPSAKNGRPWHFIVSRDHTILDRIPEFHPNSAMLLQASLAIIVCGDVTAAARPEGWMVDCAAATQNILLAAHALGLGAVWVGIFPVKERVEGIRKLFNLPDHIQPLSLIPIGYADENPPHPDRLLPEHVHHDDW